MKSFKKSISYFLPLLAIIVLLSSCQKENLEKSEETSIDQEIVYLEVSEEIKQKFSKLKYNSEQIQKIRLNLPTGEKAEYYSFEDMLMDEAELDKELSKLSASSNPKQYQSTNLVNPRVITVHGVTNGAGRLSPNGIIGLRRAITNYNNLGLDITFSLTFGSPNNADILIYRMANSPLQRVMTGYPSAAGDPFGLIIIPDNFDGFNRNQMEHQLTHNLGHCIGMRHSDWQTRESCGAPWSSEAPAQWIFGTATTFEFNSIFNACMHSSTTGEFNTNDIVALRRIY